MWSRDVHEEAYFCRHCGPIRATLANFEAAMHRHATVLKGPWKVMMEGRAEGWNATTSSTHASSRTLISRDDDSFFERDDIASLGPSAQSRLLTDNIAAFFVTANLPAHLVDNDNFILFAGRLAQFPRLQVDKLLQGRT